MRIHHLQVTAFEGVSAFDAPLAGLTLIAGPNHSGKSSLLEAIRFALTGEVERVKLKRDFPLLVHDGSAKAKVALNVDGEVITGTLPTGKHANPVDPRAPEALALDTPRFMRLPDDARRTLLFDLAPGDYNPVTVARERLGRLGIPAAKVDQVLPLLRVGFPAAHEAASKKQAEARAAWRAVTGEVYGVNKAEGWSPALAVEAPTADEVDDAATELQAARVAVKDAAEALGALGQRVDPAEKKRLTEIADALPRVEANLLEGETKLGTLEAEREELIAVAEQSEGLCFECPCCGKPLRYQQGRVSERTVDTTEAIAANVRLQELTREITATTQGVDTVRNRVETARRAKVRLIELAELAGDDDARLEAEVALAEAEDRLTDAQRASTELQTRLVRAEEAALKVQKAEVHHHDAKQWGDVVELFAPDGLPSELLGHALKPVNDALRDSPAGWPVVQLRGDMTLTVGGRPYGLCSESEQWSADLLISAWIAERTDSGLVIVDRFDVLEPAMRVPFLEWMADRAEAGSHQFIVAGTFHSAPAIDWLTTYWIERPVIVSAQAA